MGSRSDRVSSADQVIVAIKQAISENNEGARLVRQCNYDSAAESFNTVLKILKPYAVIATYKHARYSRRKDDTFSSSSNSSVIFAISFDNKSMDTDTYDSSDDTTTTTAAVTAQIHPSSPSKTSSLDTFSTNTCASHESKHFVFLDPIVILPESMPSVGGRTNDNDIEDELSSLQWSLAFIYKILLIVMYNFALTLHLHALSLLSSSTSSNHSRNNLFLRSRYLYEVAFKMHQHFKLDDFDDDQLFNLTLLNNLGLLYRTSTVNKKVNSTQCFRNIFSFMMCILDSPYESVQSFRGWDIFLVNSIDILFQ